MDNKYIIVNYAKNLVTKMKRTSSLNRIMYKSSLKKWISWIALYQRNLIHNANHVPRPLFHVSTKKTSGHDGFNGEFYKTVNKK